MQRLYRGSTQHTSERVQQPVITLLSPRNRICAHTVLPLSPFFVSLIELIASFQLDK